MKAKRFDSPFNVMLWYKFELISTKETVYVIAANFDDATKQLKKMGISSSQYNFIKVKE